MSKWTQQRLNRNGIPFTHLMSVCQNKGVYSEENAKHKAAFKSKKLDTPIHAYYCRRCNGWHIGHAIKNKGAAECT